MNSGNETVKEMKPAIQPRPQDSRHEVEAALDSKDVFRIVSWEITRSGESRDMLVTIAGRAGRSYTLVESETLAEPWNTVDTLGPLASDQSAVLEWKGIPENRAFVRVRVDYSPTYPIPE